MYVIHTKERFRSTSTNGSLETRRRRPVRALELGLVVAGMLCVPLVVVSAILGRLPVRGVLLGGALLFAATWIALTVRKGARSA